MYMKKISQNSTLPFQRSPKKPDAIAEISKKLNSSAALNGGFETLLFKIDKIEQSQGQLVFKVDKIHDAIYDPNDGIFSKLGEYKLQNAGRIHELEQNINELQLWKEVNQDEEEKSEKAEDKNKEKLLAVETAVFTLNTHMTHAWSILKWFLVAVGGGIITLTVKWFEKKFN